MRQFLWSAVATILVAAAPTSAQVACDTSVHDRSMAGVSSRGSADNFPFVDKLMEMLELYPPGTFFEACRGAVTQTTNYNLVGDDGGHFKFGPEGPTVLRVELARRIANTMHVDRIYAYMFTRQFVEQWSEISGLDSPRVLFQYQPIKYGDPDGDPITFAIGEITEIGFKLSMANVVASPR